MVGIMVCPECRGKKTVSAFVEGKKTECKCGECAGSGVVSESDYIQTPCPKCGQVDHGQTGEHPCSECGLPIVHDDVVKVEDR